MEESSMLVNDDCYEFSAPRFFDFMKEESVEDIATSELWFQAPPTYPPSPFMPKIMTSRSVKLESLRDFSEEPLQKASESSKFTTTSESATASNIIKETALEPEKKQTRLQPELKPAEITNEVTTIIMKGSTLEPENKQTRPQSKIREEVVPNEAKEGSTSPFNLVSYDEKTCDTKEEGVCITEHESVSTEGASSSTVKGEPSKDENKDTFTFQGTEACTPKPPITTRKGNPLLIDHNKQMTDKKIASMVRNPSGPKSKNKSQLSQAKSIKPSSVRRDTNLINKVETPNVAQESQAIKRQKLEGEKSRQILSIKTENLLHKTRPGLFYSSSNLCSSTAKARKEDRKIYVREPATPFISMAEAMKKFQSNTREMSLSHDATASVMQRKYKLTLTIPKEPEFETMKRVRSVRVKSSAELEEEMMAKIPKFKAHPINKKILKAPTLAALPRSTPQPPEFEEFHLETLGRANQNAETSTVASAESDPQNHQWKLQLTAPKEPILQTSLRARPSRIKSSDEMEKEELEKIPNFKARPLNKKIFESKGALGVFCNIKREVTLPQEFHFATDERILPAATVSDLFDKLTLFSEPHHDKWISRNTAPNPFHLHTEERGAEKEKKFVMEVVQKKLEEERARVPKPLPYPYTTDYPVVPPKPEPKHNTKPEPFQLESLVRHEEEIRREMEERRRMEMKEAQLRIFKAKPVLKEDPIPVPEKIRKPLTDVKEFNLHVKHRAVNRAEFDEKIKEKEIMHKRYREEAESEKMMEEQKALKQLRRTLVPHAKPVPQFNRPFLPQRSSKELTKPKSPKLKVFRRKERQETICAGVATSSPASHMR